MQSKLVNIYIYIYKKYININIHTYTHTYAYTHYFKTFYKKQIKILINKFKD